jgi:hypothetical protein
VRNVSGQFGDYHSLHPVPPRADYEALTWNSTALYMSRVRVRAFTCSCQSVVWELCAGGGLLHIRRTDSSGPRPSVHSSDRWNAGVAQEQWRRLLRGYVR